MAPLPRRPFRWEFAGKTGWAAEERLHVCRLVTGRRLDVLELQCRRRRLSHLAAAHQRRRRRAVDLWSNGTGGHRDDARWPLAGLIGGPGPELHLASRTGWRTADHFRGIRAMAHFFSRRKEAVLYVEQVKFLSARRVVAGRSCRWGPRAAPSRDHHHRDR